jgi:hypothetical protein
MRAAPAELSNVASSDGTSEQRITREIQHDLQPRFIGPNRLLAVMGEPRHRRSYLYDLETPPTPRRIRLFHNNTVRTIAPEYQWAVSPDGTQILIGAERDGDTVSPDRGVYVVDLRQRVTKAEVLKRLHANLASEMALKAGGTRAFQPIAAEVRSTVARASAARIFEYEKALFDVDSKHISQPGNRLASEFLYNTYKSFGYEPEYQWFEPRAALGGRTANVVATLRGTVNPELVYVVSSHYDSVVAGPGADDDTSGTAALLEAARVMAGHPMPATIVFASFTGEEAGLLGSREFVRRAAAAKVLAIDTQLRAIDTDLANAMHTISAIVAIAMARHGQVSGSGVVGNRPKEINGWAEAINDGVTNAYRNGGDVESIRRALFRDAEGNASGPLGAARRAQFRTADVLVGVGRRAGQPACSRRSRAGWRRAHRAACACRRGPARARSHGRPGR